MRVRDAWFDGRTMGPALFRPRCWKWAWASWLLVLFLLWAVVVFAQSLGSKTTNAGGVTCPLAGSSVEILPARGSRQSYSVSNDSGTAVRVGFLATGTANLTDSNSIILNPGGNISSSPPNIYFGRIVCMSTTAGAIVIHYVEETRQ